ncbi:MAG: LPO_1073/Vpar_1526 family protein [Microvirga sp.]
MSKQDQKGGIGSTNIQIGVMRSGLTYIDVRDIAKDVFEANMQTYTENARLIANERAAELREELVEILAQKPPEELSKFDQPEKQSALFEAQKSYALSGDKELKKSLVNMMINLSTSEERSIKSIVLQEAIKTVPSLTPRQIQVLSVVFLVRYSQIGMALNLETYASSIKRYLRSDYISGALTEGDFRHIEYTRCASVEMGEIGFAKALKLTYPGLVSRGYDQGDLIEAFSDTGIPLGAITRCYHNNNKFQIIGGNAGILDSVSAANRWTDDQKKVAIEKLEDPSHLLSETEILTELLPKFGGILLEISRDWESSKLKNLSLTSIGIALSHSYTLGAVDDPADISIWL